MSSRKASIGTAHVYDVPHRIQAAHDADEENEEAQGGAVLDEPADLRVSSTIGRTPCS